MQTKMRPPQIPPTLRDAGAGPFWTALALTGVLTGISSIGLALLLEFVQRVAWKLERGAEFLTAVEQVTPAHRVIVLLCAGALIVAGQLALKHLSSSNGIDTTAAIWFHAGRLPVFRTMGSALLSLVGVGMGVSLGREGAPQQFGAAFANRACDVFRLSDEQRRLIVACGAGAGMGAAYGVTLGGALYALEVFRGALALRYVLPALFTAVLATGISFAVLPDEPTYVIPAYENSAAVSVVALCTGPLIGLAAVAFIRVVEWADRNKPAGRWRLASPLVALGLLGTAAIWRPELLGNGRDLAQRVFADQPNTLLLAGLALLKPAAVILCIRSGVPGGLFTPSLTAGALLGGLLGHTWAALWPGLPPAAIAVVGAGAMVAATTQGPISTVVLMMELTGRDRGFLVPLVLAIASATVVARTVEYRSIYEARLTHQEIEQRRRMRAR